MSLKIVIDDKIPYIKGVLDHIANVHYLPGGKISREDLHDADTMIIRTRTKCNASLLDGTKVKFIATATIGFDHIDTDYCRSTCIRWTNAPGCNSSSVEQYIVSALLHIQEQFSFPLQKTTLGIVGVGHVGAKVARAARAIGLEVLLNDPPRQEKEGGDGFVGLEELLKRSDIVTMHVPLSEGGKHATREMCNFEFFGNMKPGAVFINSSRGEVVDEFGLKAMLKNERLRGAVLDVYKNEPDVDQELLELLTIATPHIAGYSADGKANGTMMSVQALSRFYNLGLDDWNPSNVPHPDDQQIFLEGSEPDEISLIREAYNQTYRISDDHQRFMKNIKEFEKLRGDYPMRREPAAYNIKLFNDDGKYRTIFENLGFDVIGDTCM